jgi:hypothetical protein
MRTLEIPHETSERLRRYLDTDRERMAFLLASPGGGDHWIVRDEQYLVDGDDYDYQGPFGMELADHIRPDVIGWAHGAGFALVEVHAHLLPAPTSFSPTDLSGLADVVPHMLWRLPGRPYTALVFGLTDVDALTWETADKPNAVESVLLGNETRMPTGIGASQLSRTVRR